MEKTRKIVGKFEILFLLKHPIYSGKDSYPKDTRKRRTANQKSLKDTYIDYIDYCVENDFTLGWGIERFKLS